MKNNGISLQKWGSVASFTQAAIFFIAPLVYFVALPAATGLDGPDFNDPFKLRPVLANPVFDLGDFLFGPLWAASLVLSMIGMREYFGESAARRMQMAVMTACLSATLFVAGGVVQTVGRHYISMHPELSDQVFESIFRALSMVVPGLTSSGRHFLGWTLVLIGAAGWATHGFSRVLCILYFVGALFALFAYLSPGIGELILLPGVAWNIWQGILLWRNKPPATTA